MLETSIGSEAMAGNHGGCVRDSCGTVGSLQGGRLNLKLIAIALTALFLGVVALVSVGYGVGKAMTEALR